VYLAALNLYVIDVTSIMSAISLTLPRHLAIIMDGNGRWARDRGLPRVAGHQRGADSVHNVVTACRKRGVDTLSLFAFSSQNWSRPSFEVEALMALLTSRLVSERPTIMDNGIRLTAIGDLDRLPYAPRNALFDLIQDSSRNRDMTLCLCLSYGGRDEIAAVARRIAHLVSTGELDPKTVDESLIDKLIWSSEIGPIDFLIRTSGEQRISNFMLWGLSYAELYFTDLYWPDFGEDALDVALDAYRARHRRFGSVD
jgi:undecaprenyl diphosphate synthase